MCRILISLTSILLTILLSSATIGQAQTVTDALPGMPTKSPEAARRELSERILEKTKAARDKLLEKVTTAATQDLQQTIIADLQQLIESLRNSPPPQGGGDSPPPPDAENSLADQQPQDDTQQKNQQMRRPKPPGTGAGESQSSPQDSEERQGENRESKLKADRKRRLENDIWGHLPPALREQLLNTYGERMLPQYEEFVKKFYEALSEPQRAPQRQ